MGALPGLLFGLGVCLLAAVWLFPPTAAEETRRPGWLADLLNRAGLPEVSSRSLIVGSVIAAAAVALLSQAVVGAWPISVAFGAMAGGSPTALIEGRARRRRRAFGEVWPEAVDNLASGVRAGLSLPEALSALGVRGPEPLRPAFAGFALDYHVTGRPIGA